MTTKRKEGEAGGRMGPEAAEVHAAYRLQSFDAARAKGDGRSDSAILDEIDGITQGPLTPPSLRQPPRIVAECWTCGGVYKQALLRTATAAYKDPEIHGKPLDLRETTRCRAAGHDVREVSR